MRTLLRLLLAALLAIGAALLAWQWMDGAQQQALKQSAKRLLGSAPLSQQGLSPPDSARGQVAANGLLTGDEQPFAFAAGPWSVVAMETEAGTLRPNLRFDFEPQGDLPTEQLSRAWARSGTHSFRMAPQTEYSPGVRRRIREVAVKLSAVEVGLWMRSASPKTLLTAVVSIDRGEAQLAWFGKDLRADTAAHGGQRLNASFLLRDQELQPQDIVSVYLWKRGGEEAFIDDLDIFFHSEEVPGKAGGQALPLDSLRPGGPAPWPYAAVSVRPAPVDDQRFRPGLPAPQTTTDAVAIGSSGRFWRFVPNDGLAWMQDTEGKPLALVRPWSQAVRGDVTHYDRVVAEPLPQGLLVTGCDVVRNGGPARVAAEPPPMAVIIQLQDP